MPTKLSAARVKANQKWDKENMTTIAARVKRDKAEQYKAHAIARGMSLNALIIELLERDIQEKGS